MNENIRKLCEQVLALQANMRANTTYIRSQERLAEICPTLAKALLIALDALDEIIGNYGRGLHANTVSRDALAQIQKLVEGEG